MYFYIQSYIILQIYYIYHKYDKARIIYYENNYLSHHNIYPQWMCTVYLMVKQKCTTQTRKHTRPHTDVIKIQANNKYQHINSISACISLNGFKQTGWKPQPPKITVETIQHIYWTNYYTIHKQLQKSNKNYKRLFTNVLFIDFGLMHWSMESMLYSQQQLYAAMCRVVSCRVGQLRAEANSGENHAIGT